MDSGKRVLLVDDEPALLMVLRRAVEQAYPDAMVVYASDAATAEWQLQSTSIRLVFTDLNMQHDEHAGVRVVEAAQNANIPVAVITGAVGEVVDALEARGVEVIPKHRLSAKRLGAIVAAAFADDAA